MDEKISKLFLPLLDKLYNTEPAGEPFRKPVDVVKYGCHDYYYYVKHPIDLSTIRNRLISHQYKDAWRFVADIQQMFANAYLFNRKGTPVYEFTNKLNKIWNSELTPIMQRLNYCCGTLHKFGPQLLFCHGTTPDRYCQIPIGAKYKCYQDQYSFCMPCFNKIEYDYINIQNLSCETARMKLPTQPVKKSDFIDCANDNWQYESFIQCTQCTRRVHQICDLYPADDNEVESCVQHAQLEHEQKMLCQVPEEYRIEEVSSEQGDTSKRKDSTSETRQNTSTESSNNCASGVLVNMPKEHQEAAALDDELLQFARDIEDSHMTSSSPPYSNFDENRSSSQSAKDTQPRKLNQNTDRSLANLCTNSISGAPLEAKNSVDNIAARLSINKLSAEAHLNENIRETSVSTKNRDKFVCNHCYRKKRIGFNLRHRKFSARRLPHTRMSRYIETKVNEHIRENSPTAGEVTIRVLTAYRDTVIVKQEMKNYVQRSKQRDSQQHPNINEFPDEFQYTNRAIFAWQDIDGVDVCVFGMHVQEYGEDCPEPNRQVIYLSYLDSVHFFRPKQVRTAVYHEILLSYFKYVKKLGFRRVFIWVCPSRKGDDYIFYRHPSEQKMPTLKRLSDWYVNLLDKGIMAGIVERHQNIHQYASSQNWTSITSMPYLSGDYWPGEFERLLKIMIESQNEYEAKMLSQDRKDADSINFDDTFESREFRTNFSNQGCLMNDLNHDHNNLSSLNNLCQKQPQNSNEKNFNLKNSFTNALGLNPVNSIPAICYTPDGDSSLISMTEESKLYGPFTPDSSRSDFDQPLDLSKASSTTSPESYFDDDLVSESSFKVNNKKKKRKSNTLGYSKKRGRGSSQNSSSQATKNLKYSQVVSNWDNQPNKFYSQPSRSSRYKTSTQASKDPHIETLLHPEEELAKNLERSLKRQREGFIVARLNECDCSPHFESQRRKEELSIECDLMKGREPFLQLARLKNYEFSTLRRAKFSSLAMVKHLGQFFKLEPICNECYSFDSSKRHYACSSCDDYYLCTSCHENTHHNHIMSLMTPATPPDIDEFLQQCSLASTTNSISSASSTISNKSINDSNLDSSTTKPMPQSEMRKNISIASTPLHRHLSNTFSSTTMPLSCQRQKNHDFRFNMNTRAEDEENANICSFSTNAKLSLSHQPSPPPSHSTSNNRNMNNMNFDVDEVLVENFIRHAEVSYDVDFDQLKGESKKLLSHYVACPVKETCHKCKFVVLSCSFMSVFMRSNSRLQMLGGYNSSDVSPANNTNNNHPSGINLTTSHRLSYQPKEK